MATSFEQTLRAFRGCPGAGCCLLSPHITDLCAPPANLSEIFRKIEEIRKRFDSGRPADSDSTAIAAHGMKPHAPGNRGCSRRTHPKNLWLVAESGSAFQGRGPSGERIPPQ